MKRSVLALVGCLAAMATLSSPVLAQKGGKGGGGGGKGGGEGNYSLTLTVLPGFVTERHGADAAIGVVTRDNPDLSQQVTVTLTSSDDGEATVPTTVTIPAEAASTEFYIDAVDDAIEDGVQTVTLTAQASGANDGTVELLVKDDETLPAIEYGIHSITLPPHIDAVLNDMNNLGECVGFCRSADDNLQRACGYFPGRFDTSVGQAIDLNTLDISGIPAGYILGSAIGINDLGQVVGYMIYVDNPDGADGYNARRGYVLDTRAEELTVQLLPDEYPDWTDTFARKINNNGDILGIFTRTDGTGGAYLFNPDTDNGTGLEFIDGVGANGAGINPALNGEPTVMVAPVGENGIIYAKGVGVLDTYDIPIAYDMFVNDSGTVFGSTRAQVEVQVRKNKTEVQDIQVLFKDTGAVNGIQPFTEFDGSFRPRGINAAGTLINWEGFLQTEEDGWVDVYDLVAGTAEERAFLLGSFRGSVGNYRQNDFDVMGYGDVAASHNIVGSFYEWVILMPQPLP